MTPLRQKMLELMHVRNYSARTIEAYVYWISVLAKHFGRSPDQLSGEQIEAFQVWLREDKRASWSGFNQALCAMRFFYREVLGRQDMMSRLKYARRERRLPEVLSVEEVRAMLDAARNLRELTCVSVLYGCGLRIGELLHLRVEDIDSSRGLIRVRKGKGNKDRYVPLPAALLELLREYWHTYHPKGYLFASPRDPSRPLTEKPIHIGLRELARRAGVRKHVTPRMLRHTYATHQVESGVNMRLIQTVLGHRSLLTTQRYTQVSAAALSTVTSPLDRITLPGRKR